VDAGSIPTLASISPFFERGRSPIGTLSRVVT